MTHWRSKHIALTIYYFNVYEINCCVLDWHICVFYTCDKAWLYVLRPTVYTCDKAWLYVLRPTMCCGSVLSSPKPAILLLRCDTERWQDQAFFSSVSVLYSPKSLPTISNLMVAVRFSAPCASFVFSIVNYHRFTYMGKLRVHPVVPADDASKRRRNAYGLRMAIKRRDAFGKYSRHIELKVPRWT